MKPSSGSIIQFSGSKEDSDDAGDCGGIPLFYFFNVSAFEKMAEELVEMFKREVILKFLNQTSSVGQRSFTMGVFYLTAWLAEINIDTHRKDEILAMLDCFYKAPSDLRDR
ncbi:hypothetical protein HID58_047638 [Brassica napus]|uniref:Uncharacterized protein n=1 Tax=Brassica napus TaxID=3708 RepID=A0ABQ8AZV0_BRANA|nr:hypothetical protein HID58_047638 [Brassica napus]